MIQSIRLASLILIAASSHLIAGSDRHVDPAMPALLPLPQSVSWTGSSSAMKQVKISLPTEKGDELKRAQMVLELKQLMERNAITHAPESAYPWTFQLGEVPVPGHWQGQADEAYRLISDNQGVRVIANRIDGLYRGLQTLRQLVVTKDGKSTVAHVQIEDYPAFKIRGLMHDVGRNFQSIDQLKMQIDVMAAYKMSHFHWHLSEYHGWRLESKIYPGLQEDKAFERWHGKYYTQQEFKEMSDYCWARGITIIPEFDSPGHSTAFRRGVGVENMRDPRAIQAMTELVAELCTLAGPERMPYIHIGTDEVRYPEEKVNADYLPALHKAVHDQGREVIGWWKGMVLKGDTRQIQQTWAQASPLKQFRHIDSRSNYLNHLEALDFAPRMHFQQPCRVPHGDEIQLGGILAHWPDTRVADQALTLTNNPVIPAMVAYSEAVWTGIKTNQAAYWAKLPAPGSPAFASFVDFENRIAEQRDRFMDRVPFPMVKTHPIEWRLLGPVSDGEVPDLENAVLRDRYEIEGKPYNWTKPLRGGAIHIRHFFGFEGHLKSLPKGKDIVWGNTHIHSPRDQEVLAWINFNTISSSDERAGAPKKGNWGSNPACNIWINGERVPPPDWQSDGSVGKEIPLIDQVYTSRKPSVIRLKKGWNSVLVKSAPQFKWVFSFSPVEPVGINFREVDGLRYAARLPEDSSR
ncbi:MAG: family 20 glycosylhydrolase [Luteolibacter sp.]